MEMTVEIEEKRQGVVGRILAKLVGEEMSASELELVAGAAPCDGYLTKPDNNCDMHA